MLMLNIYTNTHTCMYASVRTHTYDPPAARPRGCCGDGEKEEERGARWENVIGETAETQDEGKL